MELRFVSKVLEISFAEHPFSIILKPGKYRLEAYGASGGGNTQACTIARDPTREDCIGEENVTKFKGNTKCQYLNSQPGSGGYASGVISLKFQSLLYINIGGAGTYGQGNIPGGYNGGGRTCSDRAGSGGGATDFRLFVNSLYSRILVAGGGGGSDDTGGLVHYSSNNDGTGGSGGLIGQAMWLNGNYYGATKESNTTSGFSFGQGQRSYDGSPTEERAGAGGGWFGGYSVNSNAAGAGGGSSFAFAEGIEFPTDLIESKDENGTLIESAYYMFRNSPQYHLTDVAFSTGIWSGNGMARISLVTYFPFCFFTKNRISIFPKLLFVSVYLNS